MLGQRKTMSGLRRLSAVALLLLLPVGALAVGFGQSSAATATAAHCAATPVVAEDSQFRPGQVWTYATRPGEEGSTLTILRVEKVGDMGTVIHVRIDGIHLHNCKGGPAPTSIAHTPFSRETLSKSVIALLRTLPTPPDAGEGYKDWLTHCGGAYTLPVSDIVKRTDQSFGKGLGCGTAPHGTPAGSSSNGHSLPLP